MNDARTGNLIPGVTGSVEADYQVENTKVLHPDLNRWKTAPWRICVHPCDLDVHGVIYHLLVMLCLLIHLQHQQLCWVVFQGGEAGAGGGGPFINRRWSNCIWKCSMHVCCVHLHVHIYIYIYIWPFPETLNPRFLINFSTSTHGCLKENDRQLAVRPGLISGNRSIENDYI